MNTQNPSIIRTHCTTVPLPDQGQEGPLLNVDEGSKAPRFLLCAPSGGDMVCLWDVEYWRAWGNLSRGMRQIDMPFIRVFCLWWGPPFPLGWVADVWDRICIETARRVSSSHAGSGAETSEQLHECSEWVIPHPTPTTNYTHPHLSFIVCSRRSLYDMYCKFPYCHGNFIVPRMPKLGHAQIIAISKDCTLALKCNMWRILSSSLITAHSA